MHAGNHGNRDIKRGSGEMEKGRGEFPRSLVGIFLAIFQAVKLTLGD